MNFVWIGCISDHFYFEIWWYIYIIFCSEQMTWKLHKFDCISDHFCVLQNTDIYIYISEQITWNLYEMVACQIMFVSYKIMIYKYIYIYIYVHIFIFRANYMKFVWIGCMSGHYMSKKTTPIRTFLMAFYLKVHQKTQIKKIFILSVLSRDLELTHIYTH